MPSLSMSFEETCGVSVCTGRSMARLSIVPIASFITRTVSVICNCAPSWLSWVTLT